MRSCTIAAERKRLSQPVRERRPSGRCRRGSAALAAATAVAIAALAAEAAGVTDRAAGSRSDPAADLAREGKRIYRTGRGAAGPEITALIGGEDGTEVSAAELPCAGCHGLDGRGRPEGGVNPSDLTWEALSRPYAVGKPGGRSHPAYDRRTLKRAITLGIDAGGSPLLQAMPRYRLTQHQAAALIAYLERLGHEVEPGVTAASLRIGVLLPPSGPESVEVRRELDAFAAHLAAAGGIYGRGLELRYLAPDAPAPPPSAWRLAVARFLSEQRIFALAASAVAGSEREIADLAAEQEVPVVGALTSRPRAGPPVDRYVFYLQPGLAEQARALVEAAAGGAGGGAGGAGRIGLLVAGAAPPGGDLAAAAAAAREQCQRLQLDAWTPADGGGGGAEAVAGARRAGVVALVFLGGEAEARELLARADALAWHPRVYLLAALAAGAVPDAPAGFAGRLYLAAPSLPSELTPRGRELLGLAAGGSTSPPGPTGAPPGPATAQPGPVALHPTPYLRAALAAAELLREALTRCGREVSRDRLIAELEGLRDFETGLVPPLTFGPDRRVGAAGAYLVTYDPERGTLTAAGWVSLH